ncbi:MotA/TolQ/ExbB proton channel family protein [Alkalimarinus alittae]|uniref:MotA/TolQ/ExbB proton channel family protein n=1 Tax=Alkalimarinus alittae TaxID=2961619 RepID=A0ABY6N5G5_9ALTE|nr:MotA/TolQ/ExbB proton channel family protein [Alkalimarinus alittae]UZE97222.1 MotA/TolQ/ExbB proton channel family protein [Alkalimarinus alittae]
MKNENNYISGRRKLIAERVSVKHAFLIAVVIGAFCIVLGILFNSIIFSMAVPPLVMIGYIVLVNNEAPDLPKSTIGDSYYYLGFILTLISLVVSLFSLSASDSINMNSIIGSFGAALGTTIVGLVARLWVTAFSIETKVRIERLETEMEKSLTQFTEQLDILTSISTNSLTKVHSETESTLKGVLSDYQSINAQVAELFKSSMEGGAESVKLAFDGLTERINKIKVDPDIISSPLESALAGLVSTIEEHKGSYHALNLKMINSNNDLSKQLSQSSTIITGHISAFESELAKVVDSQSKSYQKNLEEISSSILSGLGDVKDVKMDLKSSVTSDLESLKGEILEFTDTINLWNESLSSSLQNFDEITDLVTINANHMSSGASRLKEATVDFSESLGATGQLNETVTNVVSTIRELNNHLTETIKIGQAANIKIESSANSTEQASHQVASDIAKVYGSLAEQLKSLGERT